MNRIFREFGIGLLVFVTFSAQTHAQGFSTKDPIEYNDYIVAQQNNIGNAIMSFSELFNQPANTPEKVKESYNKLLTTVKTSLKNVSTLSGFDGNFDFRDASVSLFNFYQDVVSVEYLRISEIMLMKELGDPELNELNKLTTSIATREQSFDNAYTKAQTAFASKHGFKLDAKEPQKQQQN